MSYVPPQRNRETITQDSVAKAFSKLGYQLDEAMTLPQFTNVLDRMIERNYRRYKFNRDLLREIYDETATRSKATPRNFVGSVMRAYEILLGKIEDLQAKINRTQSPSAIDITMLQGQIEECQSLLMAFGEKAVEGVSGDRLPEVDTSFRRKSQYVGQSPIRNIINSQINQANRAQSPAAQQPVRVQPFSRPSYEATQPASRANSSTNADMDYRRPYANVSGQRTKSELDAQYGYAHINELEIRRSQQNNSQIREGRPPSFINNQPFRNSYDMMRPIGPIVAIPPAKNPTLDFVQAILVLTAILCVAQLAATGSWFHYPGLLISVLCVAYAFARNNFVLRFLAHNALLVGMTAAVYHYLEMQDSHPKTVYAADFSKIVAYLCVLYEGWDQPKTSKRD